MFRRMSTRMGGSLLPGAPAAAGAATSSALLSLAVGAGLGCDLLPGRLPGLAADPLDVRPDEARTPVLEHAGALLGVAVEGVDVGVAVAELHRRVVEVAP